MTLQLGDWDQRELLRTSVLAAMQLWLPRPLGFDLLVQTTAAGSLTRQAMYARLLALLQPLLQGPVQSQPPQQAEDPPSDLEGLGQQVSSELQRIFDDDGNGMAR